MSQIKKSEKKFFYGWLIVFVSFLIFFTSRGPGGSFGNLINIWSSEFGWNLQQISLAASLHIFILGLSQPLMGWLVTRFGPKKVTLWGLIIYGLSSLLLSAINNLWQLYFLYGGVMGLAGGACGNVSLSALVSQWFYRRRGIALSITLSGMSVGQSLLIPFSMAFMLLQGWRMALVVLSLLILGIAFPLTWRFIKDTPQEMGLLPDGETKRDVPDASALSAARGRAHAVHPQSSGLKAAMRTSSFWILVGSYFICGTTVHLVGVHFVPSAINSGYSPMTAASAAGIMWGGATIGIWLSGFLSDYVGRKVPLASLYFLRALGLLLLLSSVGEPALYLSAFLIGFGNFGTAPITAGLVADIYGVASMGTILGIVTMGHQLGGGLSIYLGGHMAHVSGNYYWVFLLAAFTLFAASLSCLFIREKRPHFAEAIHSHGGRD